LKKELDSCRIVLINSERFAIRIQDGEPGDLVTTTASVFFGG